VSISCLVNAYPERGYVKLVWYNNPAKFRHGDEPDMGSQYLTISRTKCRSKALQNCICDINIRISFSLCNSPSCFTKPKPTPKINSYRVIWLCGSSPYQNKTKESFITPALLKHQSSTPPSVSYFIYNYLKNKQ